jgi:LysR family nitrogen assimilation transcriptional regulator
MKSVSPPKLDLRHLYYFLVLAEHHSISAAASSLEMAQPSLSERIAKLEQRLDLRLATRSAKGVELTEAGAALATGGRDILDQAATLVAELQQISGVPVGEVAVALPPSIGLLIGVPLAETILSESPMVRLHLTEAMSSRVLDMIYDEYVHIGCILEPADSDRFVAQPLLSEEMFVVTAPDNWEGEIGADGRAVYPVPMSRLPDLPMVLPNHSHGARTLVEKCARAEGVALNVVMQIDALPQIIEVVKRASAYAILPQAAVITQVAHGDLAIVPIEGAKIQRTAYLVRKRSRPLTAAALAVQDSLIAITAEMIARYKLAATFHAPDMSESPTAA